MLDELPLLHADERVVRAMRYDDTRRRMERMRAEIGEGPELDEAIKFYLAEPSLLTTADKTLTDLLREIVTRPPTSASQRYSDGTFNVLYTALEDETAAAEYAHWAPRYFPNGAQVRLHLVSCNFKGRAKDVRTRLQDWPWLIHDSDYGECQKLGVAARAASLDGLIAPSARRQGGTTVPIMSAPAISEAGEEGEIVFSVVGPPATFTIERHAS